MKQKLLLSLILTGLSGLVLSQTSPAPEIEAWITKPDRSALFEMSTERIPFSDKGRGRGLPISHSISSFRIQFRGMTASVRLDPEQWEHMCGRVL